MITLGLVDSVDDNGVYVTMPGSRGVLRGPYRSLSTVAAGTTVLVASTDDGEQVVVGPADGGNGVYNVRAFGAVGDGTTDDSAAIQAALDAASAAKATVVVPPGTYRVLSTLTVGSDTTIVGTGTIDALIPGDQNPVLWVHADDVHIEGITVVGNKSEYVAATDYKHGISISSANRVTVRDVTTTYNKGDGVYVGAGETIGDGDGDPSTLILLENVTSEYNHRQGLSVISAIGLRVVGGSYSHTSGTAPEAGIDIEADISGHRLEAIEVVDVLAHDNAGAGVMVVSALATDAKGVRISGGRLYDNATYGVWMNGARGVVVEGVTIDGNAGSGVYAGGTLLDDVRIDANVIKDNGEAGVRIDMSGVTTRGLSVTRNAIVDNNTSDTGYSGLEVTMTGPVVTIANRIGNVSGGHQEYGIVTSSGVTAETHIGNTLTGNDTAASSYGGTAANRTVIGAEGVGFFGAAPAGKQTVTGSRGGNAALQSLLTGLANLGLITDSSS